jgi:hypothetical protein
MVIYRLHMEYIQNHNDYIELHTDYIRITYRLHREEWLLKYVLYVAYIVVCSYISCTNFYYEVPSNAREGVLSCRAGVRLRRAISRSIQRIIDYNLSRGGVLHTGQGDFMSYIHITYGRCQVAYGYIQITYVIYPESQIDDICYICYLLSFFYIILNIRQEQRIRLLVLNTMGDQNLTKIKNCCELTDGFIRVWIDFGTILKKQVSFTNDTYFVCIHIQYIQHIDTTQHIDIMQTTCGFANSSFFLKLS